MLRSTERKWQMVPLTTGVSWKCLCGNQVTLVIEGPPRHSYDKWYRIYRCYSCMLKIAGRYRLAVPTCA